MNNDSKETKAQEDEYFFPYHYVTTFGKDSFKQHFVDTWGINYALTLDYLIQKILSQNPSSLIDIGCGDGRLVRELSINSDIETLFGVDSSLKAIGLAKAMNSDRVNTTFEFLDITKQNTLGKFDVAVLMEVFEHIPLNACNEFIQGVRRLIKPGGKLFLTVPHTNKDVEYKHFQHFTTQSLVSAIEPYFLVNEITPFEKISTARVLLGKILCNKYFVLNNVQLLNFIYRYHKNNLFFCRSESECQRIFVEAVALS